MSVGNAVLVFVVSLIGTFVFSEALIRGLATLGANLKLTDGFLGLLTALGADAPEVTAAITALVVGAGDLGRGVVLGSNIFNLAMLLGLGAVVAGCVQIRRRGLLLDGTVAVLALLVVAALLLGLLAPIVAMGLLVIVLTPYVTLLAMAPHLVDRLPLPDGLAQRLAAAVRAVHEDDTDHPPASGSWLPVLLVPLSLVAIVGASVGVVRAAVTLGQAWHLPQALMGGVVLAALTSIPNAYTAIHLARRGRGAAVVSATVNSNTINLVMGLALPALVLSITFQAASDLIVGLAWLLGMTVLGLLLLLPMRGMTRVGGMGLILLYLSFVVLLIVTQAH